MSEHPRGRVEGCVGCCESEDGLRRRAHHGLQNVGLMSGYGNGSSVIGGMVFTMRGRHCHLYMTQLQGYGGDEGRRGQVWVAYEGIIDTFDERQRHSHDPG